MLNLFDAENPNDCVQMHHAEKLESQILTKQEYVFIAKGFTLSLVYLSAILEAKTWSTLELGVRVHGSTATC